MYVKTTWVTVRWNLWWINEDPYQNSLKMSVSVRRQGKGRLNTAKYSCIKCWTDARQLNFYIFFIFCWDFFYSISACSVKIVSSANTLNQAKAFWEEEAGGAIQSSQGAGLIACCWQKGFPPPFANVFSLLLILLFPFHWIWNSSDQRLCSLPTKHRLNFLSSPQFIFWWI